MKSSALLASLIFLLAFAVYGFFSNLDVGGDTVSMYYPAKKLLTQNSLNFWNDYNTRYRTYYFKLPFTDTAISHWGAVYPIQTPGVILITALVLKFFGDTGFQLMAPFFSAVTLVFFFLLLRRLIPGLTVALMGTVILFLMPVFFFWATITQNISLSTAFLAASIYYLVVFFQTGSYPALLLSSAFIGLCGWVRIPHFLFLPAFLPFLLFPKKPLLKQLTVLLLFAVPLLTETLLMLIFNYHYFGSPLYFGYLKENYHPLPPGYPLSAAVSAPQLYTLQGFKAGNVINALGKYITGSLSVFFPLLPLTLLGVFSHSGPAAARFKILFLVAFIIFMVYYGYLEPSLWTDLRPEYYWSLSLAFFRYLMPLSMLCVVLLSFLLSDLFTRFRPASGRIILSSVIVIHSFINIGSLYFYQGGASLGYFREITSKTKDYSRQLNPLLAKNSVILYDTRWPFAYTFPHTEDYIWFYYDGIPPEIRLRHTADIVSQLLNDHRTVYFLHNDPPYDTLSRPVEADLRTRFDLAEINGTYFPRMGAEFYQVKLPRP